jgi:hypothetical protein
MASLERDQLFLAPNWLCKRSAQGCRCRQRRWNRGAYSVRPRGAKSIRAVTSLPNRLICEPTRNCSATVSLAKSSIDADKTTNEALHRSHEWREISREHPQTWRFTIWLTKEPRVKSTKLSRQVTTNLSNTCQMHMLPGTTIAPTALALRRVKWN